MGELGRCRVEKVEIPGVGGIDKARRLEATLNTGNEIGRRKVAGVRAGTRPLSWLF